MQTMTAASWTPAARAFAAEVSLSFDRMIAAAEACGRPSVRHILRVSAKADLSWTSQQVSVGPVSDLQTEASAGNVLFARGRL